MKTVIKSNAASVPAFRNQPVFISSGVFGISKKGTLFNTGVLTANHSIIIVFYKKSSTAIDLCFVSKFLPKSKEY